MYNGKSVACVMVVTMFPAVARHSHAPILGVALLATIYHSALAGVLTSRQLRAEMRSGVKQLTEL